MKTNKYKQLTAEQKEEIRSLFERGEIKFVHTAEGYLITASNMYEYVSFKPGLSVLQVYQKIAKILNCMDGDEIDRESQSGCETCDYGSKYSFTLRFW